MLMVWVAPHWRASSRRFSIPSITITFAAPISVAAAAAFIPKPPAPWITTESPIFMPPCWSP